MEARSTRLLLEALEDRWVPSTVAYADFNNDGLMDMAALSGQKTITVSLAKSDGSYTVSAILTAPKPTGNIGVNDLNSDGNPDIYSSDSKGAVSYWLGNGGGAFTFLEPWKVPKHGFWF